MKGHDADKCWCGDDFDGQCPCPCAECRGRSVDPVERKKEESGAAALLAWIELLNDQQWQEFEKWFCLYGKSAAHYFPAFLSARLEVRYAEWERLTEAQKLRHEDELMALMKYEADCADAEDMCAAMKSKAAWHYMKVLQRVSR